MRFQLGQRFAAPVTDVADAFCDPRFYAELAELPKLGQHELLDRRVDGDRVHLQVRYRFAGELSAAARAVLDPERLTWVEHAEHDLAARVVTFHIRPDHYADRLTCHGRYRFEPDGDGTVRLADGEVKVKALLVAGAVERAIVTGLTEHAQDEVAIVERWLARSTEG
ncbi:hypothetical protein BH20ACT2_BH20ACT2_08020 [soil metagenome]